MESRIEVLVLMVEVGQEMNKEMNKEMNEEMNKEVDEEVDEDEVDVSPTVRKRRF